MISISFMRRSDCNQVCDLQKKCFSIPWSAGSIREMFDRPGYYNLVAREISDKNAWRAGCEESEESAGNTGSETSEESAKKTGSETSEESAERTVSETSEEPAGNTVSETSEESAEKTGSETSEESAEKTDCEGCEENRIIGYIGILAVLDEADITNVAVDPACRRKHVATRLLDRLLKDAEEQGISRIYLEVRESNQAAIRLYEKAGFILSGRRQNYYEKPSEDALLMVREG